MKYDVINHDLAIRVGEEVQRYRRQYAHGRQAVTSHEIDSQDVLLFWRPDGPWEAFKAALNDKFNWQLPVTEVPIKHYRTVHNYYTVWNVYPTSELSPAEQAAYEDTFEMRYHKPSPVEWLEATPPLPSEVIQAEHDFAEWKYSSANAWHLINA